MTMLPGQDRRLPSRPSPVIDCQTVPRSADRRRKVNKLMRPVPEKCGKRFRVEEVAVNASVGLAMRHHAMHRVNHPRGQRSPRDYRKTRAEFPNIQHS